MEFEIRTKPFSHQAEVFEATKDTPRYALFWEMGCGKTKTILDTANWLYCKGEIDALVVLAPNGVHRNWITDELPVHFPEKLFKESRELFWQTSKSNTKWFQRDQKHILEHRGLIIVTIPYTSVITVKCKKFLYKLLETRKCLYVADEAVHFKNPNAKRTKTILASAKYAQWRRVLTGTPIANGPFDAYAIMKFLDLGFWKQHLLDSFSVYKHHFGVFRTDYNKAQEREYEYCVAYRRLDELGQILATASDRRLKEEVLDLPPKLFTKRYFELATEQRKLYEELKEEFLTVLHDEILTAPLAITRLLRLQQIVSGYIPADGGDPIYTIVDPNPRMILFKDIVEEIPHQAIVWAKFTRDIDAITSFLGPERCVRYDGRVSDDERAENKALFQAGKRQYFVANQAVGSEGLTLVQAKTVVYYNNSYKLTDRLQSEDRPHRIGQDKPVNYIDIVAQDTVDVSIVDALRKKRNIADMILGDEFRSWL
ncbi:MAG: SNF2-related protein [bacterium]